MSSVIFRTATRVLMPLLLLFALFLLFRGHNEPGGGFAGGLVVAAAFVLHVIAWGVAAGRRALLVAPSTLVSVGLLIALTSGLPAVLAGRPYMTAAWTTLGTPEDGIWIGTPLVFDIGVFLAVIGVVLTIVFTLANDLAPQFTSTDPPAPLDNPATRPEDTLPRAARRLRRTPHERALGSVVEE